MLCKACNKEISDAVSICPYCGKAHEGDRVYATKHGRRIEYEYDCDGKLLKKTFCAFDGYADTVEVYDEAGNKVKSTGYFPSGNIRCAGEFEYDGQGRVSKAVWHLDDRVDEELYEYNGEGKRTKMTVYRNGCLYMTTDSEYSTAGELLRDTVKYGERLSSVTEYDRDTRIMTVTKYITGGSRIVNRSTFDGEFLDRTDYIWDGEKNEMNVTRRDLYGEALD